MGMAHKAYRRIRNSEKKECGSRIKAKPMESGNKLIENQSFKRYAFYPMPSALSFRIPISVIWPLFSIL
jgi:hypothetical protein